MNGWSNGTAMSEGLPPKRAYKLVLFDVSGVLVDLAGGPESLLPDVEDAWTVWSASNAVRRFETGETDPGEFASEMISELDLTMNPHQLYEEFASWPIALHAGVPSLMAALRTGGVQVATLSNTNVIHWPVMVNSLGLGQVIEHHFPSHVMGVRKPERDAFNRVIEYFGFTPTQVLFFDDSTANVEAARRLGCGGMTVNGLTQVTSTLHALGLLENGRGRKRRSESTASGVRRG